MIRSSEYNIFRWYRAGWGRYTQSDPLGKEGDAHPYLYGYANPLSNIDPLGEKSRLCCTPVTGGPQPFNHCFVESNDGKKSTTYSLHRVKRGLGCSFKGDSFDLGAIDDPRTQCGEWKEGCEGDQCVAKEHAAYPRPVDYSYAGPNSNTYAKQLATACGLDTPKIADTWRTPGWGDPVPKANPRKKCPPAR